MLEEMRKFVEEHRFGDDAERYYAKLTMELMAMIGSGKVFFGTDQKNPITAMELFLDIKRAVRW